MKKVILLSLLILTICSGVYQNIYAQNANTSAALNKEEQKVMDYIDANMPRAIALLKESVNINSGTLNIAGVKKVGEIFAREFEKANFKTQWISMPDSLRRAGHLVATTGFNHESEVKKNTNRKTYSKGLDYTVAFLTDVLKGLGVSSPNSSQIKFMKAWRQHEGAKATYNPFNTTQRASGATNYNGVGVKNYTNRAQGLKATLDTLNNGRYSAIITAIKNIKDDNDINAAMQAVNDSPWGSNFSPVDYRSWKTLNNYIYGYTNEG